MVARYLALQRVSTRHASSQASSVGAWPCAPSRSMITSSSGLHARQHSSKDSGCAHNMSWRNDAWSGLTALPKPPDFRWFPCLFGLPDGRGIKKKGIRIKEKRSYALKKLGYKKNGPRLGSETLRFCIFC